MILLRVNKISFNNLGLEWVWTVQNVIDLKGPLTFMVL